MAISVDDSTVARVDIAHGALNDDPSGTTASFTAPDNSALVVSVACDTNVGVTPTLTVSGGGLTWSTRVERGTSEGAEGYAAISRALNATSQSLTVQVTVNNMGSARASPVVSGSFKVYIVTGHDTGGADGNVGENSSTTNNITPTVIASTAGAGRVFTAASEWNALGTPSSTDTEIGFTGSFLSGLHGYKATDHAAAAAVTFNFDASGTSAADWNWVAYEVLAATGGGGGFIPFPRPRGMFGGMGSMTGGMN